MVLAIGSERERASRGIIRLSKGNLDQPINRFTEFQSKFESKMTSELKDEPEETTSSTETKTTTTKAVYVIFSILLEVKEPQIGMWISEGETFPKHHKTVIKKLDSRGICGKSLQADIKDVLTRHVGPDYSDVVHALITHDPFGILGRQAIEQIVRDAGVTDVKSTIITHKTIQDAAAMEITPLAYGLKCAFNL